MLTREGGWVVCEMSTKVNKRWVHGSFMVNVDFQRIASSLFTWLKLKKFSSNDSNVISSKAQVSWFKKPLFRENFYTCFSMQSGSQSETDAALLVASPSWASRIWPCCEHLTQSCFLKVLSFLAHKSRALEVTFFWSFPEVDTVSARIEPQSWLDPHPTKILIEPQSKRDIEKIEPHLELTPTQATNTYMM